MVNLGSLWISLAIGLALSGAIAAVAARKESLSPSGVAAAVAVGAITLGLGGPSWGAVLVGFFVSSSALSRLGGDRKREATREHEKGARRDGWQVLANGGLGTLLAISSQLIAPDWAFPAFVGSIAAVAADTWATEIGTLGQAHPRLITTLRRVPVGTSGGVSLQGTLAGVLGAGFVGIVALGASAIDPSAASRTGIITSALIGGVIGGLVDSLVGATVQATYFCKHCGVETERAVHRCGSRTALARGPKWVNNDVVNFACSAAGGAIALGLWASGLSG